MTALIIATATATLLGVLALTAVRGGHLRLQEAAANGWRSVLMARESSSLDRQDRMDLTARLWVP